MKIPWLVFHGRSSTLRYTRVVIPGPHQVFRMREPVAVDPSALSQIAGERLPSLGIASAQTGFNDKTEILLGGSSH